MSEPMITRRKAALVVPMLLLSAAPAWAAYDYGATIRSLPLTVVYGGTILLVIGAIKLGYLLGKRRFDLLGHADPIVTPVSGALMGLLAFILAFTFNISMSRFEMRKTLYIDQVDAIENFFRRADLLPDKYRTAIQAELVGYTELRIASIGHPEKIEGGIIRSDAIHNTLWKLVEEMSHDKAINGVTLSLITTSLTDLIVVHNKRVVITIIYHIHSVLWAALYVLVIMAMLSIGYNFGMSGAINWTLVLILSFSFSAVIILISDLDRSGSGGQSIIKFNQQGMVDLRARLGELSH